MDFMLIPHEIDNTIIAQRAIDGYVNATAMCSAVGKLYGDYDRLKNTQAFLNELSTDMGIPISELVVVIRGGVRNQQGTWVHPDVAINLGQWCSPRFAVAVSRWVREWSTGSSRNALPYHIRRYIANSSEIPPTHFSILNEMIFGVLAPMENQGYATPENMMSDVSQGRLFCRWLREVKGMDTDALPTYPHRFEDGRCFPAKLYPLAVLSDFRNYLYYTWLPIKAPTYFGDRDPTALPYLQSLINSLPAPLGAITV
jgi:hypothetical protein